MAGVKTFLVVKSSTDNPQALSWPISSLKNMIDCEFLYPLDLGDATNSDWEYSGFHCTSSAQELVENATSGASFYIDKTFTYGDVLMTWFFTIILIGGVALTLFNIFWKK